MHDLIDGAPRSGTVRLAEVALLGAAIAGAASLVLAFGASLDVRLQITSAGRVDLPAVVLVAAGAVAVAFYAYRLGAPRRALGSAAALGGHRPDRLLRGRLSHPRRGASNREPERGGIDRCRSCPGARSGQGEHRLGGGDTAQVCVAHRVRSRVAPVSGR
jgi:hypothetical protein